MILNVDDCINPVLHFFLGQSQIDSGFFTHSPKWRDYPSIATHLKDILQYILV